MTRLISAKEFVEVIFSGLLKREIADADLLRFAEGIDAGMSLPDMVSDIVASPEFIALHLGPAPPASPLERELPNLQEMMPECYYHTESGDVIFRAGDDNGVEMMKSLIYRHRYYDAGGIWSPVVDLDKHVTATIMDACGARRSLELGCYSGSVISLLVDRFVDAHGVDISHSGFLLADDVAFPRMTFGRFPDLTFDRPFDCIYAMDVLEHVSPLELDDYVAKIAQCLSDDGFAYVNSPMFGIDRIFGQVFSAYVKNWRESGERQYWYDMHCDDKGWPMHGHLVWASPVWWEELFRRYGLVRDVDVEQAIQGELHAFFAKVAPARKSAFVLRKEGAQAANASSVRESLKRRLPELPDWNERVIGG